MEREEDEAMTLRKLGGLLLLTDAAVHVVAAGQVRRVSGPPWELGVMIAGAATYLVLGRAALAKQGSGRTASTVIPALAGTGLFAVRKEVTVPRSTVLTIVGLDAAIVTAFLRRT